MICLVRKGNQCPAHGKLFIEHHNHDEKNRGSVTFDYTEGYENIRIPFVELSLPRRPCAHKGISFITVNFHQSKKKKCSFAPECWLSWYIQYNVHNSTVSLNRSFSFNSGESQSINSVCVTLETDSTRKYSWIIL